MINNTILKFAGDVTINFVELVTSTGFIQNITSQVISIDLYEDIFSPFITGKLTIKDSQDLINLFPLVGQEYMNLSISTPTLTDTNKFIKGKFYVHKMTEREQLTDRSLVYVLHFISQEALVDLNKKLSKSYEGKISDIAKSLLTSNEGLNSTKNTIIEDTPNGIKFIANYWSVAKTLNYLAAEARNKNKSPTFLFFENRNGLNFQSLDSLYIAPSVRSFVYDNYMNTTLDKNPEEQFKRIIDISIPVGYDYMDSVRFGSYGSKLIGFDILTKKYTSKNYNYLNDFSSYNHLNQYPISSKVAVTRESAFVFYDARHNSNFNGYTQTNNKQKRISSLGSSEFHRVNITVPGRTDYTVGQKVYVKLYKNNHITSEKTDDDIDNIYSGFYLIAAINHDINRDRHTCNFELIKDSLQVNLDKGGRQ